MGLIEQARLDIQQITSNPNDFGVHMTFVAPSSETITVYGLHKKHHTSIDSEGNPVNSKNANVSFSEALMVGYPIRNGSGEVNLANHQVTVKDSTGNDATYVIREWYPDETIGLIVCILGDFE